MKGGSDSELWAVIAELRGEIQQLRAENAALRAENAALKAENAALKAENAALRAENAELRRLLDESRRAGKRQATPFSKGTPKSDPKKPGRKPGSGYGKQAVRPTPQAIDHHRHVPVPLQCPDCGGQVTLAGTVTQRQTDIPPIKPETTEFEIDFGKCTRCGRRVQGRHVDQISDATGSVGGDQIGPNAISLAAHLNKTCGVSYERIAEIFSQVFQLRVSRSTLCRAMLRLAKAAEPTYLDLVTQVRFSPIVYPDETGWKVGGQKAWLWAVTTLSSTVYLIERGRGYDEAVKILGKDYCGHIGCDGWAPYRRFIHAMLQLCLAHLLRRCREQLEAPPTPECAKWFAAVKAVLQDALALRDRRDDNGISPHGLRVSLGKLEARLDRLLDEPDLHDDSLRFAMHLFRYRDSLFGFVLHPDLEATNHLAEQAIRPAVINRKTSGGNRTWAGAGAQGVLMSIFRTCKLRAISALDVCRQMLSQQRPTALLVR